jgi:hypothetical protein
MLKEYGHGKCSGISPVSSVGISLAASITFLTIVTIDTKVCLMVPAFPVCCNSLFWLFGSESSAVHVVAPLTALADQHHVYIGSL